MSHTTVFPRSDCPDRTDELFRERAYGSHHKEDQSPLVKMINLDMIEQFPVSDSLHLFHLGIMKRLLSGWRDGTFRNADTKWPSANTIKVSQYLINCKIPAEFHRVVRGLDCLAMWKGTEFRTFLHYLGIVVLKDHLTNEAYGHFLLLYCSVTIFISKQYFAHLQTARSMILQYVEMFAEIYGAEYITSNVHNLTHVADEVARFGELESFSSYPFETMLGRIKALLRNGHRPLAQVAKRMTEEMKCVMACTGREISLRSQQTQKKSILSKRNNGENVSDSLQTKLAAVNGDDEELHFYSKVEMGEYCVNITKRVDFWILTHEHDILRVINIARARDEIYFCCTRIQNKRNFFHVPIESRHFGIYSAMNHECHFESIATELVRSSDVKCKLVCLPYHDMNIFIPLLHTNVHVE